MKQKTITAEIELPKDVTATVIKNNVTLKGKKGEVVRHLPSKKVQIMLEGNIIKVEAKNASKNEKTIVGSFESHIKNMVKGCTEGHEYELKIASLHFPMNVSVAKGQFIIKNFLGEKIPRVFNLIKGVNVKVEGDKVYVDGNKLEDVSQTAASIEQLTRIRNRDTRIFQDGIYIIVKDGKSIM
ncbi:50S ribosomal protein L6 [Candidatus Woesearchaeota archaeon]|nr:50S ribosomal protein L6 [Candidatus Woesearchaeota archaeon]